jgi:AICAR transformylase/IMP cyclohydrolase PurH
VSTAASSRDAIVPEHVRSWPSTGSLAIDLVCVNLYPFEMTVRREGVQEHEAIEQIDIGGPSMLRSSNTKRTKDIRKHYVLLGWSITIRHLPSFITHCA